jgi:hypothetical protein
MVYPSAIVKFLDTPMAMVSAQLIRRRSVNASAPPVVRPLAAASLPAGLDNGLKEQWKMPPLTFPDKDVRHAPNQLPEYENG